MDNLVDRCQSVKEPEPEYRNAPRIPGDYVGKAKYDMLRWLDQQVLKDYAALGVINVPVPDNFKPDLGPIPWSPLPPDLDPLNTPVVGTKWEAQELRLLLKSDIEFSYAITLNADMFWRDEFGTLVRVPSLLELDHRIEECLKAGNKISAHFKFANPVLTFVIKEATFSVTPSH